MSTQTDNFCNGLRDRLDAMDERFQSAKANILALPQQGEQMLRTKLDEARTMVKSRANRVEQAVASMNARAQEKLDETNEKMSQWKAQRDVRKLNVRADRAEGYAADAIDFAAAAIDEADAAVLDALVA